jgi:hypothetical protein
MNNTSQTVPGVQTQESKLCLIETVVSGQKTSDGAGVTLHRSLGTSRLPSVDPFLMLDEFKSDNPNDYIAGFPSHPHRGFETVTYMLAGKLEHKDNRGNVGVIGAGGVQWMTAGRGIIHSEMPIQENGLMWGFQLWVNLSGKHKMKSPSYQNINPEAIPEVHQENGTVIRVIAGHSFGTEGVVEGIDIRPLFLDVRLPAQQNFDHPIEPTHSTLIYVYQGDISSGNDNKPGQQTVHRGQLAVLSPGNFLAVQAVREEARFLVLSGKPIREPVAKYGPFVMNTQAEIQQAIHDYQSGEFAT